MGKTELDDWYPLEICFDGIVTDGIGTEVNEDAGIEADGIADAAVDMDIEGTDDGRVTAEESPMVDPLPNFKSSPPNCTSNCPMLSPGISTAELGIFEDGGILGLTCVDDAADGMPKEGAGPFAC